MDHIKGSPEPSPDPYTAEFERDIAAVLNRHCIDSATNTPDFILAGLVADGLRSFAKATSRTASWRTA